MMHFFPDCSYFINNFQCLWNKLKFKINGCNPADEVHIDGHNNVLLLLGRLAVPLDNETNILINCFLSSAVGKSHKLCTERLHKLKALWLVN